MGRARSSDPEGRGGRRVDVKELRATVADPADGLREAGGRHASRRAAHNNGGAARSVPAKNLAEIELFLQRDNQCLRRHKALRPKKCRYVEPFSQEFFRKVRTLDRYPLHRFDIARVEQIE